MTEKIAIPTEENSTTNLALTAFAIARYDAKLLKTELDGRQVRFFVELKPGLPFEDIEKDFNGNGFAPCIAYSDALRHLKGVVVRALSAKEASCR